MTNPLANNCRIAAVNSLAEILRKNKKAKESIEKLSGNLDRRDRAFVMEVVYGVLRNLYPLDRIIGQFVKNIKRLNIRTYNNLRASVYQIFIMNVPGFAVVNEAVKIERSISGNPSLVNAVLRNIIRKRNSLNLTHICDNSVEEISVNYSHPEWLINRWVKRFGIEEATKLAEANNTFPGLTIRANTIKISRDALTERLSRSGMAAEPTEHSPEGIRLGREVSFTDLHEFTGLFSVQDEASQLISHLLAPQQGQKVLDACAAPGGKTSHIAQLMHDRGNILCADKDEKRLQKLRNNILALGIKSATVIHADALSLQDEEGFDGILLDAPCSSTGVIRRNPDVRYRRTEKDIIEFSRIQLSLLKSVSQLLRPNGRMVYSVCSTEPEEGEMVITDFLKTDDKFSIIDTAPDYLRIFMKGGFFRSFPHKHDMDGFFGAILCRKK